MISLYSICGTYLLVRLEVKSNQRRWNARDVINTCTFDASPIDFRDIFHHEFPAAIRNVTKEYCAYFKLIISKLLNCRCDTQFSTTSAVIRHASQFHPICVYSASAVCFIGHLVCRWRKRNIVHFFGCALFCFMNYEVSAHVLVCLRAFMCLQLLMMVGCSTHWSITITGDERQKWMKNLVREEIPRE